MTRRIAGIDIHKKVLMVVLATVVEKEIAGGTEQEIEYEGRRFGGGTRDREQLVAWLQERQAEEVVMESTAQYWKPVWMDLEPHFRKLFLAQAHSNKAPKGRKNDFADARRLTRRMAAGELILSFVPEAAQRTWRTVTRGKTAADSRPGAVAESDRSSAGGNADQAVQRGERSVRSQRATHTECFGGGRNRSEHTGGSGQRAPEVRAGSARGCPYVAQRTDAPADPEAVDGAAESAGPADRCSRSDGGRSIKEARRCRDQTGKSACFGVDSAQQIIAEVGCEAKTFPSAGELASWVGSIPGSDISAECNHNSQSPKGNKYLRRIFNQAAQAAVKTRGCHFQNVFRRLLPKLGYNGAIWAVANRLCRLTWLILHIGVSYIEQGDEPTPQAKRRRAQKLSQALRKLGYQVVLTPLNPTAATAAHG